MIVCSTIEIDLTMVEGINSFFRITDAPHDVVKDGSNYLSFGSLLKIDGITYENLLTSQALKVFLTGLDPVIMNIVNSIQFRNKSIIISKCMIADDSNQVVDSTVYYRGLTSTPETTVDYDAGSVTLGISCQSIFSLEKTPSLMRANNALHQFFHPGDLFFQYANDQQLEDEQWQRD